MRLVPSRWDAGEYPFTLYHVCAFLRHSMDRLPGGYFALDGEIGFAHGVPDYVQDLAWHLSGTPEWRRNVALLATWVAEHPDKLEWLDADKEDK